MSGASTAGTNQTPYSTAWAGGNAVNAPEVALHNVFHAQNTTPNATAMADVTMMSTGRHVAAAMSARSRRSATDVLLE